MKKKDFLTWLFIFLVALLFVGFAFNQPEMWGTEAEVEAMSGNVISVEHITKLYDVPLDAIQQEYIREVCEAYGVEMPLVLAIIGQESNYDLAAVGDNGESVGLMQVQEKHHGERMKKLGVTDLTDPQANVLVGVDYLAELLEEGRGAEWAITAYNAGRETAHFNKQIGVMSEYTESVLVLTSMIEHDQLHGSNSNCY